MIMVAGHQHSDSMHGILRTADCHLTTKARRRRPGDASIATVTRCRCSLQRMVRPVSFAFHFAIHQYSSVRNRQSQSCHSLPTNAVWQAQIRSNPGNEFARDAKGHLRARVATRFVKLPATRCSSSGTAPAASPRCCSSSGRNFLNRFLSIAFMNASCGLTMPR
jgi:hypothetical protein